MKLSVRLAIYAFYLRRRLLQRWYRLKFFLLEGLTHKVILVGSNVTFSVPVRSGGKGTLKIGNDNTFGFHLSPRLGNGEILLQARSPESEITLGCNTVINNNTSIIANSRITIGSRCLIGDGVVIFDSDFHQIDPILRNEGNGEVSPVTIGDNVWIGSRAMILKGVEIGENSVIGAMSVVIKSVPPNTVAAGVPCRALRRVA